MSALASALFSQETAKTIFAWPKKNFPNNAILTTAGLISLFAMQKIIHASYYYTLILGSLTLASVKLYQLNEEAKKRLVDAPKIKTITDAILELAAFFDKNRPRIMKKYLMLGKKTIEPMLNPFNNGDFSNIANLTTYFNLQITDLVSIWKKHPNFDDASVKKRTDLFKTLLSEEKKTEFETIDN